MEKDNLIVLIVSIVAIAGIVFMVVGTGIQGTPTLTTQNNAGQAIISGTTNGYTPKPACIKDGQKDDVLYKTSCCSGKAVAGSTFCTNWADYGTTWLSCTNICGTTGVTAKACPYGPLGTTTCPCPAGQTSNGKIGVGVCVPTPTCTDSDGGLNYNVKGTLTYTNNPYGVLSETDSCADANYVIEGVCTSQSNYTMNHQRYLCPNGCSNGACLPQQNVCYDTDGGINEYIAGAVWGNRTGDINYWYNDLCSGNYTLVEGYCQGNLPQFVNITCPANGTYVTFCSRGACVQG